MHFPSPRVSAVPSTERSSCSARGRPWLFRREKACDLVAGLKQTRALPLEVQEQQVAKQPFSRGCRSRSRYGYLARRFPSLKGYWADKAMGHEKPCFTSLCGTQFTRRFNGSFGRWWEPGIWHARPSNGEYRFLYGLILDENVRHQSRIWARNCCGPTLRCTIVKSWVN